MASTLPEQKAFFQLLRGSDWISKDPILQYKLREVALRWVEARRLLLNPDLSDITSSLMTDESGLKRSRIQSTDSIVEPKGYTPPEQLVQVESVEDQASVSAQPESLEWECKKCTFMNPAEAKTSCSICGWFKSRSAESTGGMKSSGGKTEFPVERFIKARSSESFSDHVSKKEDIHGEVLSRSVAGTREQRLTGISSSRSPPAECTVYASVYNLLVCGQAQEESAWINSVEKDVFAAHNLDEELLFTKRWLSAKRLLSTNVNLSIIKDESSYLIGTGSTAVPSPEDEDELEEAIKLNELKAHREYADTCNKILGVSFPQVGYIRASRSSGTLTWKDWRLSGVHTDEFLSRLVTIHMELVAETHRHYEPYRKFICTEDPERLLQDEMMTRKLFGLFLNEPRCDLNLHCLSHVEGDNLMDRFLIPSCMERADLIYQSLISVWTSDSRTAFVAARPPGHHCPSFEDRLIGLTTSSSCSLNASPGSSHTTRLERDICAANGLESAPREHGMGFCALNGLAVALKRFLQIHNPAFELAHNRSIRVAILDLDIHAGNGTELVFRNSRSVLHVSFHRYGWLKANTPDGDFAERVMPGTHSYKDVGGIFGKKLTNKRPKGQGYSVNITLRKGDGNAEVLSAFEAVALPILQEFRPDIVLVACGFDGLKLSPVFKQRWGEESCPGMDAEYTPSLYGYIVNRVRSEVQSKVIAATEGGYDPISVGLAARSVVKGLKGTEIPKPPIRTFNSDWIPQLNNIFQLQQMFWGSLNYNH